MRTSLPHMTHGSPLPALLESGERLALRGEREPL
jgi:hypothetical protein